VLRDQINEAVKGAMKAQEKLKLSTLRLVNAAIKNADIEAQMTQKPALTDADVVTLMQKMIKQRQDSVAAYEQGGRKELADQERTEIEIIKGFLPQQHSDAGRGVIAPGFPRLLPADMGKVITTCEPAKQDGF
jgi:uncharacterized protein YqeY